MPKRLVELERDLEGVLARVEPDWVCVESIFSHCRHPRTAITMAHARGVILLAAARRGIEIVELPPAEVKKALTGSGRASKSQVQRCVMVVLGLGSPPEPLDVSDALAIAICGTRRIRNPIAAELSAG